MHNRLKHMYRLNNIPMEILDSPPKTNYGLLFDSETDITNLNETLIFLWLDDGDEFWFYITYSCQTYIEGYRWREGPWTYLLIPVTKIKAYY